MGDTGVDNRIMNSEKQSKRREAKNVREETARKLADRIEEEVDGVDTSVIQGFNMSSTSASIEIHVAGASKENFSKYWQLDNNLKSTIQQIKSVIEDDGAVLWHEIMSKPTKKYGEDAMGNSKAQGYDQAFYIIDIGLA